MCLGCAIRKMRTVKGTSCLGVEFSNISPAEKKRSICFWIFAQNSYVQDGYDSFKLKTGETLEVSSTGSCPDILQMFDQLKKEGF